MVLDVMPANGLEVDDFISVIFTATSDLVSEFPAYAARRLGFDDVPLICARELEIEGSMPREVRMLAHVATHLSRADVTHVYLHGAAHLRRDLATVLDVPDAPPAPGAPRGRRGTGTSLPPRPPRDAGAGASRGPRAGARGRRRTAGHLGGSRPPGRWGGGAAFRSQCEAPAHGQRAGRR